MKTIIFFVVVLAVAAAEPTLGTRNPRPPPLINRPPPPSRTRFRRSPEPEPQGSIVLQGQKPLSGPNRHGSWSAEYQHKIWERKNGHISASGGVGSQQGQKFGPQVGIQGQWRFRRSPEPEPQGSIVLQGQKPLSGPNRHGSWSAEYQHKIYEGKNGHISASGGVGSQQGQKFGPQVGIQGQWRFRRSPEPEPQGSIVLQGQKPLSGPNRHGSWSAEYQHKIWEGKNGHISASGGAGSQQGQKFGPQVGIQGQWRFRRSPEPEPQGSIVLQGQKPLSGPNRHGSWSAEYQHKIYEGKNGHISASGGVGSQQGQKFGPQVGIQGQWRFRRSPEPEPQGSIVLQGQKPLSGPNRHGSWNLGYQHKIYEGKDGYISAQGGMGRQPGHNVGPQVGIQGEWRFRRSADVELDELESRDIHGSIGVEAGASKGKGSKAQGHIGIKGKIEFDEDQPEPRDIHGSIGVEAGASKGKGSKPEGHIGINGKIEFDEDE